MIQGSGFPPCTPKPCHPLDPVLAKDELLFTSSCCLPEHPQPTAARFCGCLQALQAAEQHMLWDAPDIRVTSRDDLRLATYIFHQVWDIVTIRYSPPDLIIRSIWMIPLQLHVMSAAQPVGLANPWAMLSMLLHSELGAWSDAISSAQLTPDAPNQLCCRWL